MLDSASEAGKSISTILQQQIQLLNNYPRHDSRVRTVTFDTVKRHDKDSKVPLQGQASSIGYRVDRPADQPWGQLTVGTILGLLHGSAEASS